MPSGTRPFSMYLIAGSEPPEGMLKVTVTFRHAVWDYKYEWDGGWVYTGDVDTLERQLRGLIFGRDGYTALLYTLWVDRPLAACGHALEDGLDQGVARFEVRFPDGYRGFDGPCPKGTTSLSSHVERRVTVPSCDPTPAASAA